jgi:hypothetical protein
MVAYFMDIIFHYNACIYSAFMGMIPSSYACTAYFYVINW